MKPSELHVTGLADAFRRHSDRRRRVRDAISRAIDERPFSGPAVSLDAGTLSSIDAVLRRHDEAMQAVLAVAKLPGRAPTPADPLATLVRIFAGQSEAAECAWALERMTAFLLARGALSLERCMNLPASSTAWARALRNLWLQRAAVLIETPLSTARAMTLARELDRFRRFQWPAWRRMSVPPEDASAIDGALFFCLRSAEGLVRVDLQWRHLLRIVGPVVQLRAGDDNAVSVRCQQTAT